MALGGVFIGLSGYDVGVIYRQMFEGALGSPGGLIGTTGYAIPVLLTGLAATLAFRIHFWNIGGDGQLVMGAFGASWVALTFRDLPAPIMLPAMVLAGAAAGAIWGLVPASLRAWLGVNEVMTSLLLNYVALLWMQFLVYGPWRDPRVPGAPNSAPFPPSAWLPGVQGTTVHIGFVIGVLAAILLYLGLRYTVWGYEINVIGRSPSAAAYAGMHLKRMMLVVMAVSGALAGLAGVGEVGGVAHRLFNLDTQGYGYIGILVAWLTRLNPLTLILVAFLYGALLQGQVALQLAGLRVSVIAMLQAAILIFALASLPLNARLANVISRARLQRRGESAAVAQEVTG
jgi:simple sugar transport system permease protein